MHAARLAWASAAGSGVAHPVPLAARHRPSGERILSPGADFSAYREACQAAIVRARIRAGWQAGTEAAVRCAPFERLPAAPGTARRELLLLHGLSDTPFQMRDLAGALAEGYGCASRAPLLPGHGTVPGDLLHVRWQDWARMVHETATQWASAPRGRSRVAVGFSTGAALAIDAALEGADFAGLILLSPAIAVSPLARIVHWHRAVSWALPRAAWLDLHADRDPVRYESVPYSAAHQVYLLARRNRERWMQAPLRTPLLIVQSEDDATVDAEAALAFFQAHDHPASRMLIYGRADAERPLDPGHDARIRRIAVELVRGRSGGAPVIGFSHLALPYRPDNPHYGAQGAYRNHLHYALGGDETALAIASDERLFAASPVAAYGEKTLLGGGRVLRRLTWNPDFDGMVREIGEFLARTET